MCTIEDLISLTYAFSSLNLKEDLTWRCSFKSWFLQKICLDSYSSDNHLKVILAVTKGHPRFKIHTKVLLINDPSDLDDFHVNFRTHFLMREMMNKLRFLEENRPFTGCPSNWYPLLISIPDFSDGPIKKI